MARRRKRPTAASRTRIRPELRPAEPESDAPDDDLLDEEAYQERMTQQTAPRDPNPASTSVGILLAVGVLVGAVVTYFTPWNLLIGILVGGVIGAIIGIVIDRRRGRTGATPA